MKLQLKKVTLIASAIVGLSLAMSQSVLAKDPDEPPPSSEDSDEPTGLSEPAMVAGAF